MCLRLSFRCVESRPPRSTPQDLENRLEVTADMSDTEDGEPMMDRLDEELRAGLMPKISTPACDQPRVYLAKEEAAHRKECEEREARWEAEVADQQSMAEEVSGNLLLVIIEFSVGKGSLADCGRSGINEC